MIDLTELPPLHPKVSGSYHPAAYMHGVRDRDDFATRTTIEASKNLYGAWAEVETVFGQLTDGRKAHQYILNEQIKHCGAAEKRIVHLESLAVENTTSIENTIKAFPRTYSPELRAHYKGDFSAAARDVTTDKAVAAALYQVPHQLLGITKEQADLINDRIEMTHAADQYKARDSARKGKDFLRKSVDAFGSHQLKRAVKLESSDDVVLARAQKVPA